MSGLRVLISVGASADRAVRDLAAGLRGLGHDPIIHQPSPGDGSELADTGAPTVERLDAVGVAPEVIHALDTTSLFMALTHFLGVPAVFAAHGGVAPPTHPRLRRLVAPVLDHTPAAWADLYRAVIAEQADAGPADLVAELRAVADFLAGTSGRSEHEPRAARAATSPGLDWLGDELLACCNALHRQHDGLSALRQAVEWVGTEAQAARVVAENSHNDLRQGQVWMGNEVQTARAAADRAAEHTIAVRQAVEWIGTEAQAIRVALTEAHLDLRAVAERETRATVARLRAELDELRKALSAEIWATRMVPRLRRKLRGAFRWLRKSA